MDARGLRSGVSRAVSYWRHFVTGQTGERIATLRRIVCRERCVGGFRCVDHCHGENDRLAASRRDAEGDCRCPPDAGLANADRARDDLDEIEAARISGRASVVWLEDDCRGVGDSPRQGARGGVRGVFWESRRRANSGLDGAARFFGWDPRQDVRWRVRSAGPVLLRKRASLPAGRDPSMADQGMVSGDLVQRGAARGDASRFQGPGVQGFLLQGRSALGAFWGRASTRASGRSRDAGRSSRRGASRIRGEAVTVVPGAVQEAAPILWDGVLCGKEGPRRVDAVLVWSAVQARARLRIQGGSLRRRGAFACRLTWF